MKKIIKYFLLTVLLLLVGIQFVRPDRTNPVSDPVEDFFNIEANVPANVKSTIKSACYDCHSNETKWPWYTNIAPFSWRIADHVEHGREELNFSHWSRYKEDKKLHKLDECKEEIEKGKMPLEGYVNMHAEAELSDAQKQALFSWIDSRLGDYEGHHDH